MHTQTILVQASNCSTAGWGGIRWGGVGGQCPCTLVRVFSDYRFEPPPQEHKLKKESSKQLQRQHVLAGTMPVGDSTCDRLVTSIRSYFDRHNATILYQVCCNCCVGTSGLIRHASPGHGSSCNSLVQPCLRLRDLLRQCLLTPQEACYT